MAKVYVVQDPKVKDRATGDWESKYDVSPASHFGELVMMLPPGNVPMDMRPTIDKLTDMLREFTVEDHLLPLGDPIAIVTASLIAARQTGGRLSLLKWDRRLQQYRPYIVEVSLV